MRIFHRTQTPPATAAEVTPSRLGGLRPLTHDDDERPSAHDRDFGQTIFTREPVPLPRLLTGRRRKRPE